ncbi:MATE family efflux transporter [Agromyces seonyuensis]|uniref:MATE family efflux transporter n=1 Tax=Agromyces seonyuensis TaxID=2662446 RepID=A0A6I4NUR4_9MICO|nr:MATE family efflux transporter [Agromyces seonyuensis]MWB97973.1 MATE family efflux transporter [Agromyces seonyuensis]
MTDTAPAPAPAPEAGGATAPDPTSAAAAKDRAYLATTPIWRSLVHLCIPMIAGLSVGSVYNIINGAFIGSLGSTPMLAAITLSLPVFALVMAIGNMFGVGGGTYATRLLGSLEEPDADHAAVHARIRQVSAFTLWGGVAAGILVAVLGLVFATPLALAVGASGAALAPTSAYIGALAVFAPAVIAALALEQLVRAQGAALSSMTGIIISTVANLVFDVVFILLLGLGVLGAGIAVGLANLVMVGYYAWWLGRRSTTVSLAPADVSLDRDLVRTVFGVGVSELLMAAFLVVTTLVMNWVAVAYGDALLAAMGVALRVSQLSEMICMGVFMGVIPLLAFAFGARDRARLGAAIRGAALAIAGAVAIFSTIVFLFRDEVFALFSSDPAVVEDGTRILTAMLVATLFNGFTGLVIAVFQATEQMRNATIMSIAQGVLFIPIVLGGSALFGLTGVIWAMTATELLVFLLALALVIASRRALEAAPPTTADEPAEGIGTLDAGDDVPARAS